MLKLATLGYAEALHASNAIQEEAARRGLPVVVAVADVFGEPILIVRMDRARVSSVRIAGNKAYSAAREQKKTADIGRAARDPETGFDIGFYGDPRVTGWPGGIAVVMEGVVVGAVAVSGATDELDDELAQIGVNAVLLRP